MTRISILLIVLALIAGLAGCQPAPGKQYTLTISSTAGGNVTFPGEGTFTYNEGEVVELVAMANEGYQFASWIGDVGTIDNVNACVTIITMNDNYSIIANFQAIPPVPHNVRYNLTISSTAGGSVTTPGEGSFTYDAGTLVNLVATPASGYQFTKWTGDVGAIANITAASTTITMTSSYSITAKFAEEMRVGEIRTWYELNAIRNNLGGTYVLMNNLDSTTAGYAELAGPTANGGNGWEPIGTVHRRFSGSFNGQGYAIRDLFVNRPDKDEVGLFGTIDKEGSVDNVVLLNADVTGRIFVGCLVGISWGIVSNCHSTGNVSGVWCVGGLIGHGSGQVRNSSFIGSVTGIWYVGGMAGAAWALSNCYSAGRVTGNFSVGGLVGQTCFQSTLNNSYSTCSVTGKSSVGGLVGHNHFCTVSNSYSIGRVIGEESTGGLVGSGYGGTVSHSFWDAQTSGQATSDGGTGKTTPKMKSIVTFSGAGWNIVAVAPGERNTAYIWNIVDGVTYPFLSWQRVS